MPATALHSNLNSITAAQQRLPGAVALLIGLAAGMVIFLPGLWLGARYLTTMAHEGGHAIVGSITGAGVSGITIKWNSDGATGIAHPGGFGWFLAAVAGYVSPGLLGVGAARLIGAGHIVTVLWLLLAGLALLLLLARTLFSHLAVIAVGGLVFLVLAGTPLGLQVLVAYGTTWFLLLSGLTMAIRHGSGAGDAHLLKGRTHLPRRLWALFWLAGSAAALIWGAWYLV